MTGTHLDVTTRREMEQLLRDARDAAEAANRSKSEFLANMSHEIRTPMTAILGYADLLSHGELTAVERREYTDTIRRNGEHLLAILNDILDLSKIEAGQMVMESVPFRTAELVEEVMSLMRVRATAKGLTLAAEIDSSTPRVMKSDPTRLRQILVNLVGNGLKFTQQGGVHLRVSASAHNGESRLRVEVRDTGIGMDDDAIGRLFKPFMQADASVTRRFGGSGLGLTISRRLARMLSGDIEAVSQPGTGSVFTLHLPLVGTTSETDMTVADPATVDGPPPRLDGLRVLLADDAPDNRMLVSFILQAAGTTVDTVENGRQAIERAGNGYDAILMDMQMPDTDGYTATRELRRRGFNRPIIALTAHAMSGDRQRCLAAGCNDYVTKPIDPDTLRRVLHQLTLERGISIGTP
jgi:CheY-like chemotaxis protein